jgi:hypothetical protein
MPIASQNALAIPTLEEIGECFDLRMAAPRIIYSRNLAVGKNGVVEAALHFRPSLSWQRMREFQSTVLPEFESLDWDFYDVRQKRKQAIESSNDSLSENEKTLLQEYYRGNIRIDALAALLKKLPAKSRDALLSVRPYRKKACTRMIAQCVNTDLWSVQVLPTRPFLQRVALTDYRSIARNYRALPAAVVDSDCFRTLLANVVAMVQSARPDAVSLDITAWMMSCYTWLAGPTTNSPEGVHQDGADYVVTAFVIERTNVAGGVSRLFLDHDGQSQDEILVGPNEGLFHADTGSPIWHDVSHIHMDSSSDQHGVRSLLGFDVNIRNSPI